ncbi:CLUMA_CG021031, isoform A [Clunio marinus]|uniref:CLUMA_CG021031, isoform A n=1 Tax=Clunio marinus TaxID=568069 RepID=A0A1J1J8V7_9DIPT|nr:CLUMA_CG021031, isoform A [Clunio marinus]
MISNKVFIIFLFIAVFAKSVKTGGDSFYSDSAVGQSIPDETSDPSADDSSINESIPSSEEEESDSLSTSSPENVGREGRRGKTGKTSGNKSRNDMKNTRKNQNKPQMRRQNLNGLQEKEIERLSDDSPLLDVDLDEYATENLDEGSNGPFDDVIKEEDEEDDNNLPIYMESTRKSQNKPQMRRQNLNGLHGKEIAKISDDSPLLDVDLAEDGTENFDEGGDGQFDDVINKNNAEDDDNLLINIEAAEADSGKEHAPGRLLDLNLVPGGTGHGLV